MQHRVSHDVRRPSDAEWQQAWRDLVRDTLAQAPPAPAPDGLWLDEDGYRLRLTSGPHLQPGAVYELTAEEHPGPGGRVTIGSGRVVSVELRETRGGLITAVVDSLDRLTEARFDLAAENVEARGRLRPDRDEWLTGVARLPWLHAELTATAPEGHAVPGEARCDVEVRGRGVWRPAVGTILAVAGRFLREGIDEVAQSTVTLLRDLPAWGFSGAPPPNPAERAAQRSEQIRVGMAALRRGLEQAEDVVRGLPWWRRSAGAWRTAYAALPAVSLPPDDLVLLHGDGWAGMQRALVEEIARARFGRRGAIDRAVDREESRLIAFEESVRVATEAAGATPPTSPSPASTPASSLASTPASNPASRSAPGSGAARDDPFDTAWLASPWTVLRRVTGASSDGEAMDTLRELDRDGIR